ncbi:MAG: Uncharacterized protein G01um101420_526 [Parcubacteria group bacterium Gr01-1014_20]|nr:MAG: Uncharacterized protein G01um101420_526 [Parcubacteria group bacterium Gr01-1014_20]
MCGKIKLMKKGMTLMEIVIVIALLAILLAVAVIGLNPVGELARARNSQRNYHINAIVTAVRQNIADSTLGTFTCASGEVPTSTKRMAVGSSTYYNIAPCLVSTYLNNLPFDPAATGAHWTSASDYNTGYNILRNASTGEITVSAPFAELGKTVSVTQ